MNKIPEKRHLGGFFIQIIPKDGKKKSTCQRDESAPGGCTAPSSINRNSDEMNIINMFHSRQTTEVK